MVKPQLSLGTAVFFAIGDCQPELLMQSDNFSNQDWIRDLSENLWLV
jgi:hypothetical protein